MKLISIFKSIDGEVNAFGQGRLTTFIRLAKCNLRCSYCDTTFSFDKGVEFTVPQIAQEVQKSIVSKVTITGGEPLLQKEEVNKLIQLLVFHGYNVSIETNGSIAPIQEWVGHSNVSWVYDYKLASSDMESAMKLANFEGLTTNDFVKFLINDRIDFEHAQTIQRTLRADYACNAAFAYSPVNGVFPPEELSELLIERGDGHEIINLQLHKIIWPNCGATEER